MKPYFRVILGYVGTVVGMILFAISLFFTVGANIRWFGQSWTLSRNKIRTVLGAVETNALLTEFTAEMAFIANPYMMFSAGIKFNTEIMFAFIVKKLAISNDLS